MLLRRLCLGQIQTRLGVAFVAEFSGRILLLTSLICCLPDFTKIIIVKHLIQGRNYETSRAIARAVDLGGPSVYQGSQSLKLSTKVAVIKRVSLLIGGAPWPAISISWCYK